MCGWALEIVKNLLSGASLCKASCSLFIFFYIVVITDVNDTFMYELYFSSMQEAILLHYLFQPL